jgi:hypothetical protein
MQDMTPNDRAPRSHPPVSEVFSEFFRPAPWWPHANKPVLPNEGDANQLAANSCSQLAGIFSNTGAVSAIELLMAVDFAGGAADERPWSH